MTVDPSLPGAEILVKGRADLQAGRQSPEALALLAAAPRLRRLGLSIPRVPLQDAAEIELYFCLMRTGAPDPYSTYNALLRSVASLAAALEHRRAT